MSLRVPRLVKVLRWGGVTVAALAALAACSSSGGGGASTAAAFAQQYCSLLAPCCADAGLSTNTSSCAALISGLGKGYNPSAGQACLDAATQASKEPGFCSSTSMSSPACSNVFSNSSSGSSSGGSSGSVQPGGSCQFDSDCARAPGGGASCLGGGFSADGGFGGSQCIQTTTGTAGQGPCIGTINGSSTETSWSGNTAPPTHAYVCDVASGLTCSGATHQCSAQVGTGQPCNQDGDCVAADYCDFNGSSGSTCTPRLPDGSSCAMSFSACMTTSYCESTSQTCKPALPMGAACGSGNSAPCQSGLCVNDKCSSSSNAGLGLICG
jgi:hypothetical protein